MFSERRSRRKREKLLNRVSLAKNVFQSFASSKRRTNNKEHE